ncbi:MAG: DUF1643 domain-containing protein [Prochlorococcaceae cyanobacterium ETNP7_MAG_30]|jgi:hypothetical protein|nr:DUF1643 domain-containing protein [Prochlorococcaceae cyanobacterium ETNP2_MAG_10]MDP6196698.1 DUF1643 domain-containing protein [Prochlorococcaceae cyanobacterium ETNP18_MAG_17]MDP6321499.1 DUF1643 domain-containing protein [Prochlorococcaceae cyanobacterium ETNP14_MAG_5]MDP7328097.1 DUF1643 domain-containing protein [Prochlorococcaceae cyanobacterium ETNP7_MAG_30]HJO77731.1 DUF1643 domain-containing protein [Prochlorococcaceae cyanobacterium Fu_MAG_134]
MARQAFESLRQAVNSWVSEASFSPCGHYRWWLKRRLGESSRTLLFVGLNPSKASALDDDPTLRRILGFCRSWGYGRLLVVNLFARISQSPSVLKHCVDPIGEQNDVQLSKRAGHWAECSQWDLWLGWGVGGAWLQRHLAVMALLEPYRQHRLRNIPEALGPLALGCTREGHPRHPLYIPGKEVLRPFMWASRSTIRHPEAMDVGSTVHR